MPRHGSRRPFAALIALLAPAAALLLAACAGGDGTGTGTDTDTDTGATTSASQTSSTGGESTTAESTAAESTAADPTGDELQHKRVFVSSAQHRGDLQSAGGGSSGLDGADRLCNAAADSAGLGGAWVAWLSTGATDAISRLPDDARWTLIDGDTLVFADRLTITSSGPAHAIDTTEAGDTLLSAEPARVWTHTTALGRSSGDGPNEGCSDWTAQSGFAAHGVVFDPQQPGPGRHWTDTQQPAPCGDKMHLYCFEI